MKINPKIAIFTLLVNSFLLFACSYSNTNNNSAVKDAGDVSADGVRDVVPLDEGWKFSFGEVSDQVISKEFDDSSWERVQVPHSWNRVGYYNNDLVDRIHRPENIDKRQGVGWYRIEFPAPSQADDKRVWLEFDAASRTAEVWLNGSRLGEHRGGFLRFRLDATDSVSFEKNNILVVKVDNTEPSAESSTADTLPIAGDFFVHGGLYRPVRLVVTDPVHIDMRDFGGPGVYATTTKIEEDRAEINVRSRMRNEGEQHQEVSLTASLIDSHGDVVAKNQKSFALDSQNDLEVNQVLSVDNPVLWEGMKNPYLYTLRVELWSQDSKILDRVDQQYGIRLMEFDPELGFLLNGEPYRLRGVAYHQDREGKGWAVSADDIEEDVATMMEMGANTIRLAHYPHGQPVHEIANRNGLILWSEIPLVSLWEYGKEHEKANEALANNAKLQLKEMIRQNYNHPSVGVWGTANEVDFGGLLPLFLGEPDGEVPDPMPLLKELDALAEREDPSRPTALATCCESRDDLKGIDTPVTAVAADLSGANLYFGWYYGEVEDLDSHLDKIRELRPDQPLSVTEYGAGGAVSLHTDNPLGGPVDSRGHDQPEEYMSYIHEQSWSILASKPYLWGSWIWNSFDFATTIRTEGDAVDINTKGLVTYDRKVKKDAFFFYKANWSESPTMHITGRRYVNRAYPVTDVRVYSNALETELVVNGRSLGKKVDCSMNTCVWSGVGLKGGSNKVAARGEFPSGLEVDQIEWNLDSALVQSYRIDSGALIASPSASVKFGSDNFFVGGDAGSVDKPGGWGEPAQVASISSKSDRDLLATFREGDFSYQFPLENGEYNVKLLFIEPELAPDERQFNVLVNGDIMLERFDIAGVAKGKVLTEVVRTFGVTVTDDVMDIELKSVHWFPPSWSVLWSHNL